MTDHRSSQCRNCAQDLGTLPEAQYCPRCGQETVLHPPTLWEFVHEFITHYVALEGALWRTLSTLVLRPGQLTLEYFHGRRKHYVLPLRIYLTASFLFFLVLKVVGGGPSGFTVNDGPSPSSMVIGTSASAAEAAEVSAPAVPASSGQARASPAPEPQSMKDRERLLDCAKPGAPCGWADRTVGTFLSKELKAGPSGIDWQGRLMAKAPYAMFLMLPLFAGLLKVIYHGRRRAYGEHFVFSLHLHTFWFLILLLVEFVPGGWVWLPLMTIPAYGCIAMRKVYGGRWGATLARAGLLSGVYGLMLALGAAALTVWLILAG